MVLAERLDESVGAGELPCGKQMLARFVDLLEAHAVHHRDHMQVYLGNRVGVSAHGERGFRGAQAAGVIALQVKLVSCDVKRKRSQAGRQKGKEVLRRRQPFGQRKVQQHRCRVGDERLD